MIGTRMYADWVTLATDPVGAVRAMADWTADIAVVMRVVARTPALAMLADSGPGTALYHVEQAHHWMASRTTGGHAGTDITPAMLAEWLTEPPDRDRTLRMLADEFARLLSMLNTVSAGPGLWTLASGAQGKPYWHAGRAHIAVLTLLAGDPKDGWRLHELWSENQEPTWWNQQQLAARKRAESVVVTVSADTCTATITGPHGETGHAGSVGGVGPLWVADDTDTTTVIGHEPAWPAVGFLLANHWGYPADTGVTVDYTRTGESVHTEPPSAEPAAPVDTAAEPAPTAGRADDSTDDSAGNDTPNTEVPHA